MIEAFALINESRVKLYIKQDNITRLAQFSLNQETMDQIYCSCSFDFDKEVPVFAPTKPTYTPGAHKIFSQNQYFAGWEFEFEIMYQALANYMIESLPDEIDTLTILISLSKENKTLKSKFNSLNGHVKSAIKKMQLKIDFKGVLELTYVIDAALNFYRLHQRRNIVYFINFVSSSRYSSTQSSLESINNLYKNVWTAIESLPHISEELAIGVVYEVLNGNQMIEINQCDRKVHLNGNLLYNQFEKDLIKEITSDFNDDPQRFKNSLILLDFEDSSLRNVSQSLIEDNFGDICQIGDYHKFINYIFAYADLIIYKNKGVQTLRIKKKLKYEKGSKFYMPIGNTIYNFPTKYFDQTKLKTLIHEKDWL